MFDRAERRSGSPNEEKSILKACEDDSAIRWGRSGEGPRKELHRKALGSFDGERTNAGRVQRQHSERRSTEEPAASSPPTQGASRTAKAASVKQSLNVEFKSSSAPLYRKPACRYEPPEFNKLFLQSVYPHVASFNTFLDFYVQELVKDLDSVYIDPNQDKSQTELNLFYSPTEYLKIFIRSVKIGRPVRADCTERSSSSSSSSSDWRNLLPRACRNGHLTYSAPLWVEFVHHNVGQQKTISLTKACGNIPIMVRSRACHLDGLSPAEMVRVGEECNEAGGYFIINGNERVIRFVIQQRCNHPIALKKPRFRDRDLFFTEYAILMRCARRDGTSTANILFFTEDKVCAFRVLLNRQEVIVPFWVLLRALMPSISLELVKQKLFETEFSGTAQKSVMQIIELDMMWKTMVEGETLFTDIDKYENRYMHQLGKVYWDLVGQKLRPGARYEDAARYVINRNVLVHLSSWAAKFECLILMYRKLLALVRGEVVPENVDSFAYQEVITPGQLMAAVLKDALANTLTKIKMAYASEMRIARQVNEDPVKVIRSREQFALILRRLVGDIGYTLNYFMATGNIKTFQLDLQQLSGWTVVADRLNVNRFLSHFRAVHRGQFFAQMRTTEVRKLLGETWGFLCPVHTPDGGPCGLLLHLAQHAVPVADPLDGKARAALKLLLQRRGIPVDLTGRSVLPPFSHPTSSFPLVFDGEPICRLPRAEFDFWTDELRRLKQSQAHGIPQHLEIAALRHGTGAFEGIFVFSGPGRLVRPVKHLKSQQLEWIGPLGQPWMNIACLESEVKDAHDRLAEQRETIRMYTDRPPEVPPPHVTTFKEVVEQRFRQVTQPRGEKASHDRAPQQKVSHHETSQLKTSSRFVKTSQTVPIEYTHVEISPSALLSITSALTPFSNHNQSPRNMYQCQMLKQTMATPFHSLPHRTDNKAYRLLFPQLPCVRTKEFRDYRFDDYPSGTNAVVAVISYTGYDMEDAMILNKGSMERGFCHGVVYKTKVVDAAPASARGFDARNYIFTNRAPSGEKIDKHLDADGLPPIGTKMKPKVPLYRTATIDSLSSESAARTGGNVTIYHDDEEAYVDKINFIGASEPARGGVRFPARGSGPLCQRVSIRLRCVRNPQIGDKFASRAGQKGIMSMLWPHEDMPFSASGLVPDIVFNPHGFPSRMTVGMLIESMAGKAAAIHGAYQDCTPFRSFPRQEKSGVPWIDQGGYHGWVTRGGRYMTPEEDAEQQTDTSIDYFGKTLLRAGYQYYGSEPLYSGIHGIEMDAHIFIGVIYYQRLRHMVSDKWQVRATGPIDALTRQPVKGRKRGGGIRFGEMERDALLAHGASCLLQDRLMHCSDEHKAFVCPACGSVLAPSLQGMKGRTVGGRKPIARCRVCDVPCRLVALPFVFRYICNELAAMNVTIRLQLSERGGEIIRVAPRPEVPLDPEVSLRRIGEQAAGILSQGAESSASSPTPMGSRRVVVKEEQDDDEPRSGRSSCHDSG